MLARAVYCPNDDYFQTYPGEFSEEWVDDFAGFSTTEACPKCGGELACAWVPVELVGRSE